MKNERWRDQCSEMKKHKGEFKTKFTKLLLCVYFFFLSHIMCLNTITSHLTDPEYHFIRYPITTVCTNSIHTAILKHVDTGYPKVSYNKLPCMKQITGRPLLRKPKGQIGSESFPYQRTQGERGQKSLSREHGRALAERRQSLSCHWFQIIFIIWVGVQSVSC